MKNLTQPELREALHYIAYRLLAEAWIKKERTQLHGEYTKHE